MSSYHGWVHRPKWMGGTDPLGPFPPYHIKLFSDTQLVLVGAQDYTFAVPFDMDGLRLKRVEIDVTTVSSGGDITVQVGNLTQAVNMLSTEAQIDAGDYHSADSGTPAVVNTSNNQVFHKDRLQVQITAAGSGAMGLAIILFFAPVGD